MRTLTRNLVRLPALALGTLLVSATSTAAAAAPTADAQPFAAQAEAAHLTSAQVTALQSKIDRYLDVLGGKQVALNKIDLDGGGTVLVALPGEAHPRDFTSGEGRTAAADPCLNAPWYNGYFCAYQSANYSGDRIDLSACGKVRDIPWNAGGSWINNQTKGLRAYMYDRYGTTIYTTPGARSWDAAANWGPVASMIPC